MKGPFIWASWMPPYLTGVSPSPPRSFIDFSFGWQTKPKIADERQRLTC
jgi:hypothetical protein